MSTPTVWCGPRPSIPEQEFRYTVSSLVELAKDAEPTVYAVILRPYVNTFNVSPNTVAFDVKITFVFSQSNFESLLSDLQRQFGASCSLIT